ncbi:MAG: hypothetical protein JO126_05505 [Alphaproteobacteria bacterium]|nr:hypothetical protein [Alphaproteobacteria bacterium]
MGWGSGPETPEEFAAGEPEGENWSISTESDLKDVYHEDDDEVTTAFLCGRPLVMHYAGPVIIGKQF